MKNTIEFSKTEGKQKAAANMRQLYGLFVLFF